MKHFKGYIKENIRWLAVILCMALVMIVTMLVNGIPFFEIGYGLLVCAFVTFVAVVAGYGRHFESLRWLDEMRSNIAVASNDMKTPEYLYEQQYQDCIRAILQEKNQLQNEMLNRQKDLSEYYSMWVHQIKTPIAALRLLIDETMSMYLDAEEREENDTCVIKERQKYHELFRIEQYADMALQYTRLGSETNDFVFQNVMLDAVIKTSIHKYAKLFIHKKLRLQYEPQDIMAVTDKKWLGFVIDQLLANAVKYTKQGGVTICVARSAQGQDCERTSDLGETQSCGHWYERDAVEREESVHIIIEDTGIGIRAEDLPRICEKGYTGYNGHADQYSTGIGLYLCKAILAKLGHRLVITSEEGNGTRAEIVI